MSMNCRKSGHRFRTLISYDAIDCTVEARERWAWEEGLEQGAKSVLKNMVAKKLSKGKAISDIAIELEEGEDAIRQIIDEINNM